MKYLIQAGSLVEGAELAILKRMLETARIASMIRNENLAGGVGEIPFTECYPELWLLDANDYPRAMEVLKSWRDAIARPTAVWVCPGCDEVLDGQFSACWQCGTERH